MVAFKPSGGSMAASGEDRLAAAINLGKLYQRTR